MSIALFRERLAKSRLNPNDVRWMPNWLSMFAKNLHSMDDKLAFNREDVLTFLRGLLGSSVPAWQRLQAVRSIEWYQTLVLDDSAIDFSPFKLKLQELAEKENQSTGAGIQEGEGIPGEGMVGLVNANEPAPTQALRARMRLLHHPISTEDAYAGWINRLVKFLDDERLEKYGENDLGNFLSELALVREVSAGTQNQALCAILFYYQKILGKDIHFINRVRAKESSHLPLVMSKQEIRLLLPQFRGTSEVMAKLMYGSGMRHKECRTLRIKDIYFDTEHILIRNGKGQKDRITALPKSIVDSLRAVVDDTKKLHRMDLQDGFGCVYLPFALERKYPNANREIC